MMCFCKGRESLMRLKSRNPQKAHPRLIHPAYFSQGIVDPPPNKWRSPASLDSIQEDIFQFDYSSNKIPHDFQLAVDIA